MSIKSNNDLVLQNDSRLFGSLTNIFLGPVLTRLNQANKLQLEIFYRAIKKAAAATITSSSSWSTT